jgi:hypothetical protein
LLGGLSIGPDGQLKGVETNPFLNLLNVRYVVYRTDANSPVQMFENRGCLNRAFVVSTYQVVGNSDGVLARLESRDTDFRNVVFLEENPGWGDLRGGDGAAGIVQGARYAGDQVEIQVRMNRRGILVLSDNYFPYWRATDNGKDVPVVRAYGTLRALCLEPGDHRVQFTYVSHPYQIAKWVTVLSIFAVILGVRREWVWRYLGRV